MAAVASLGEIADAFDVAVLDQWGVLHDGTDPYPGAADAVDALRAMGKRIAVLSNSGRRAAPNAARIRAKGFGIADGEVVTSGEALRRDVEAGRVGPFGCPLIVTARPEDARDWARGLPDSVALDPVDDAAEADILVVLGLPDGASPGPFAAMLETGLARGLTLVCGNPDRASPRPGGVTAMQPGALAHFYEGRGGTVRWYGKPHVPVFREVERLYPDVPRERFLMVGDSPEHDIAGAHAAGWRSALVRGGLHADALADGTDASVRALCAREGTAPPTVHLRHLAA